MRQRLGLPGAAPRVKLHNASNPGSHAALLQPPDQPVADRVLEPGPRIVMPQPPQAGIWQRDRPEPTAPALLLHEGARLAEAGPALL
jgi:hypothetical protein